MKKKMKSVHRKVCCVYNSCTPISDALTILTVILGELFFKRSLIGFIGVIYLFFSLAIFCSWNIIYTLKNFKSDTKNHHSMFAIIAFPATTLTYLCFCIAPYSATWIVVFILLNQIIDVFINFDE